MSSDSRGELETTRPSEAAMDAALGAVFLDKYRVANPDILREELRHAVRAAYAVDGSPSAPSEPHGLYAELLAAAKALRIEGSYGELDEVVGWERLQAAVRAIEQNRCPHGVWLGDHCYTCARRAASAAPGVRGEDNTGGTPT